MQQFTALRNLNDLSRRTVRRNAGRFAMTGAGVMLGVAILFGVLISNASTSKQIDRIIGNLDSPELGIRATGSWDAMLPGSTAGSAAHLPGVRRLWAFVWMQASIPAGSGDFPTDSNIYMAGTERIKGPLDSTDRLLRGRLPAEGANEVVVGKGYAESLHVDVGSRLTLRTSTGPVDFLVSGILAPQTRGGVPFRTSLATARRLSGRAAGVSYLWATLTPRTDVTTWLTNHADDLGPAVTIQRQRGGDTNLASFAKVIESVLTTIAALALFVGAFLIFLTLSVSVVERMRMYGTLRALGASRRQVRRVVVVEALVVGVVATAAGLLLGLGAAVALVRVTAGFYRIGVPKMAITPGSAIAAAATGLIAALVAAYVPARRASRLDPIAAIRAVSVEQGASLRPPFVGAALLAAGFGLSFLPGQLGVSVGISMILVGSIPLVPVVLSPLARLVGRATSRLSGGIGDVGVMHLVKERSRSAYTLGLVMVVLAMTFALAAADLSLRRNLERDLATRGSGDLFIWANGASAWSAQDIDAIRQVEGVGPVTPLNFGQTQIVRRGQAVQTGVAFVDPATYFEVQGFPWAKGDTQSARAALTAGGAVLMPEATATKLGTKVGGTVTMTTAAGRREFRLAATFATIQVGDQVIVGWPDAQKLFNVQAPSGLAARVSPGASPAEVASRLESNFKGRAGFSVELGSVRRDQARQQLRQYFVVFSSLILVAAVVGLLGLANTLAMSVVMRTREIGILRSVGTHRRQVRGLVLVEAATLSGVALLLAIPLGSVLAVLMLRSATTAIGLTVRFVYPWSSVIGISVMAVIMALLASIAPARRAAGVEPSVALRFD